jgi:flavodoxin
MIGAVSGNYFGQLFRFERCLRAFGTPDPGPGAPEGRMKISKAFRCPDDERMFMKNCIIFHSYTGITRGVAEKVQATCGGDMVEVKPRQNYNKLTAYTIGCLRARNEEAEPVEPESIDVSAYDLLVIGSPVWAFRPTPATNGAINALKNCDGKMAILYATCGGQAGDTIATMKKALEKKGVNVVGMFVFDRKDLKEHKKTDALIEAVTTAGNTE